MRIAFITSEYSGLPNSGGIGSYFQHAARCLANAGQEIEVFTSGFPSQLQSEKGIDFHQLGESSSPNFAVHAAEAFLSRHRKAPFDILESAELNAEGLYAARAVPEIANVVRIHSPSIILNRYLDLPPTSWQKLFRSLQQTRIAVGAWRRGLPIPPIHLGTHVPIWFPNRETEERETAASADLVLVMNEEMRRFIRIYWWIKDEAILQVPNPIQLSANGTSYSGMPNSDPKLGFIGRLEPRKGVLELAHALKQILPHYPEWSVVFAGRSVPSCLSGVDVGKMARELLKSFGARVQFPGFIPPDQINSLLLGLDLCVFPSLWESFHYAVLEAMIAGRTIVATRTGAVAEMLDQGKAGLLVDPGNVRQLANALDSLMVNPERRRQLGEAAQKRAISKYNESAIIPAILDAYRLAIERRDRRVHNKSSAVVTAS